MITTSREYFPELRRRMTAAGITGAALARAMGHGKDSARVSRWLSGKARAKAETMQAIEAAFTGLVAAQGAPEATPPEIGAPGGAGEATEPTDGMFGPDIDWGAVGRSIRGDSSATPATPPPSAPAE